MITLLKISKETAFCAVGDEELIQDSLSHQRA